MCRRWTRMLLLLIALVVVARSSLGQPIPVPPNPPPPIPVPADPPFIQQDENQDAKQQPFQPKQPVLPQPRRMDEGPMLKLVEFRDVPLEDALRVLSQQSGLNFAPSAEAAKTKVTLFLRDVPTMTAVRSITQANKLVFRRDEDGVIRIYTVEQNQRDLNTFREEQTKVFTLLYPNAIDAAQAISDLFGERVQLSFGADDTMMLQNLQDRFDRFDLIDERSLGLGVLGLGGIGGGGFGGLGGGLGGGGFGGGGFGGGGFGGGGFGGGGLGGRGGGLGGRGRSNGQFSRPSDFQRPRQENQQALAADGQVRRTRLEGFTPEELQAIEDAAMGKEGADRTTLFQLLRRRPATIYVTVVQRNNQVIVRTSDPVTMAQICELIQYLDVPTPVVLLEVKVLAIDLTDDYHSVFDWQFADNSLTAGSFTTGNILPPGFPPLPGAPIGRNTPLAIPRPGNTAPGTDRDFIFQLVSSNFRARIQFLEGRNRVTELATPLIMTANSEVSTIFTGQQQPITIGFTPAQVVPNGVATSTTVASTPITQLVPVGTTLIMTPNINADRTVTLRVLQENSRVIENGGKIPVPNPVTGNVDEVLVDIVDSRKVTGTVVAKDGLTIAIGGLIEEGVNDTRSQVPVLGRIPYLGVAFRRQETTRRRRELVFLIRPFVLSTPGESTAASRKLIESLSLHPNVQDGLPPTLGTYNPQEILRPDPPVTPHDMLFKVHTIIPKDF